MQVMEGFSTKKMEDIVWITKKRCRKQNFLQRF